MSNSLKIILCHGSKKKEVKVEQSTTLQDLRLQIEEAFHMPCNGQKLIFKGKALDDFQASLQSVGMKNGDKMMVLGKVMRQGNDPAFKELMKIELLCQSSRKDLFSLTMPVNDILEKGTATEEGETWLKKHKKEIMVFGEGLMKHLEKLDSLSFQAKVEMARGRRKNTVKELQSMMDECDNICKNIDKFLQRS